MSGIKFLFATALLLASANNYAQFTDVINSNRPGESQAAFSVGKTVLQAELGVNAFREDYYNDADNYTNDYKADGWNSDIAVRYGAFFEQLEFIGEATYQREHYSQTHNIYERHFRFKQVTVGAKFLLYDPVKNYEKKPNLYSWQANHKFSWRQFIPAVGVYGGVNFDVSEEHFLRPGILADKKVSFKAMVLTQHQFGRFVLVSNIILDKFPANKKIDYVITLTRGFNDRWSGMIEGQVYNSDPLFRIGAAYLAYENIQVDASIGTNVANEPSLVTAGVGLSWRFDANYEDVYLRIPGEKKSKEEKKKDKKKEESKKRLDAIENGEKVK
jgi:hypothetical protein